MVSRILLDMAITRFKLGIAQYSRFAPDDVRESANSFLAALERWRDSL